MKYLLFILSVFTSFVSFAGSQNSCAMKTTQTMRLREIKIHQCEETKNSSHCQQLYKMIKEDGGDLESKQLNCTAQVDSSYLEAATSRVSGCLVDGLFDSTFGALGRSIGESLAENQIQFEKNKERLDACNKNLEQKRKIFKVYNDSVPKVLKVPEHTEQQISSMSCEELEKSLHYKRKSRESAARLKIEYNRDPKLLPFSEVENEYLAYKEKINASQNPINAAGASDQGLLDKAYEKLGEFGVKLECYNPKAAFALSCEALTFVAGGARLGAMAVASGLKTARLQGKINALNNLGREGRIAKATQEIAPLEEAKKLEKLQGEIGRKKPFTEKEASAYRKAHEEGASSGEGYGTYKGDTLREKKRILMQEGGFSEREADFMILRGYVGSTPVKGDKFLIIDGRVSNLPPALTADDKIKKSIDAIQAVELKAAEKLSVTEGDLNTFFDTSKKLYEEVRAKAQAAYQYEPGKPISSHESSVIRIFGRESDYGEEVVALVKKNGGNATQALDAEMAALKSQADVYFESAKKNNSIFDYYRGRELMNARKQIGYAAEDRGIFTSIDGSDALDQFSAIRDNFMKDKGWAKDITALEKVRD